MPLIYVYFGLHDIITNLSIVKPTSSVDMENVEVLTIQSNLAAENTYISGGDGSGKIGASGLVEYENAHEGLTNLRCWDLPAWPILTTTKTLRSKNCS